MEIVFSGLPHGTAHGEIAKLPERVKIIDMSADFRLRDPKTYAEWYGAPHSAPALIKSAVYGLTEHYRDAIRKARLVACPGCYPTAVLLALLPLATREAHPGRRCDHRREVGRLGRRPHAETEPSIRGSRRGALALRHRQSPSCAGDRAGAWACGGRAGEGELHPASRPHGPRRALHLLCSAQRKDQGGRPPPGPGQGLCGQPVRARGGGGRDPGDPACARLEFLPPRRVRRPHRPAAPSSSRPSTIW